MKWAKSVYLKTKAPDGKSRALHPVTINITGKDVDIIASSDWGSVMKTIVGTMVWCEACKNVCWIYDEDKFGIGEFCNDSEDVTCPVCSTGDSFSAYTIKPVAAAMSRQSEWVGVLKYAARQFQVKWRSIVLGNALVQPWKPEFEVKGLVDVEHVRSTQERNHSNPG